MSRYIDLDKLGIGKANPDVFIDRGYAEGRNSIIDILEKADVENVVEKKRGTWNFPYWYAVPRIFDKRLRVVCSACKRSVYMFDDELTYTFCPHSHCGSENLRR